MNITVYCGAMPGKGPEYEKAAKDMGKWIALSGHSLVYGGGKAGMMGFVADAVLENGGTVTGIIPEFLVQKEQLHPRLNEVIVSDSMSERKDRMIELGEAYIALPGGSGTLDEISEIIALTRLGRLSKPCVLYDLNGFYQPLKKMYETMVNADFFGREDMKKILFSEDLEEIGRFLEAHR